MCVLADLPFPESGRPVPRVITFQRKRANRRVINEDQLVRMLREFAEVSCPRGPLLSVLFSRFDLLLCLSLLLLPHCNLVNYLFGLRGIDAKDLHCQLQTA